MVKDPSADAGGTRDMGLTPESGRSPEVGNGNSIQYSCLENPMDRGAWWAYSAHTHILFVCVQRVRHNWAHIHTHSQQDIVGWPLGKLCDWGKLGTTVQSRWWVHGYSLHDFIQLFQMLENFWKKQKYYISLPLRKQIMFILSRIDAIIKLSPEGGVYK